MTDIELGKLLLVDDKTIVLVKDDIIYEDKAKGIRPMLNYILNNYDLRGFSVADKVVGKGAAVLFIYANIKEVYAKVISKVALELLKQYHILVTYDKLVNNIINRKGDDLCPMEKAVLDINDIDKAFAILKEKNENSIS